MSLRHSVAFAVLGVLAICAPAVSAQSGTRTPVKQQEISRLQGLLYELQGELHGQQARYDAERRFVAQQAERGFPTEEDPNGQFQSVPSPTTPDPQIEAAIHQVEAQLQALGVNPQSESHSSQKPYRIEDDPLYNFTPEARRLRYMIDTYSSGGFPKPGSAPDSSGILAPVCIVSTLCGIIHERNLHVGDLRLLLGACDRPQLDEVIKMYAQFCLSGGDASLLQALDRCAQDSSLPALRTEAHDVIENSALIAQAEAIKTDREARRKKEEQAAEDARCTDRPSFGSYVLIDEMPSLISKVAPTYPEEARSAGVSGTVMTQALVGCDGSALDVRVANGPEALRDAAIAAVKQYRFAPAKTGGKPLPCWVAVPVSFTLK